MCRQSVWQLTHTVWPSVPSFRSFIWPSGCLDRMSNCLDRTYWLSIQSIWLSRVCRVIWTLYLAICTIWVGCLKCFFRVLAVRLLVLISVTVVSLFKRSARLCRQSGLSKQFFRVVRTVNLHAQTVCLTVYTIQLSVFVGTLRHSF